MNLSELKNHFKLDLGTTYPIEEIENFFYISIEYQLNFKRVDFALNPNQEISKENHSFFMKTLEKLKKEIPIQYIIGETEFYGLKLNVNEHVLIPRQETEELVNWIINDLKGLGNLKILDIGTGSGCIAISLAKNLTNCEIFSLDISKEALNIAKENAESNNTNVHFINEDILKLKTYPEKFDVIVSNPPYVRELEKPEIKDNVLLNEPHLALFVEDHDPLIFYDKIGDFSKNNLTKNGSLYYEINQYLGKETIDLLNNKGYKNIELRKDLSNNDRMIKAFLN